ncbi:oligopeptide transport system substrate-binding protein [Kibdelosporangium banguiense]|uniref:Oligopeptide transport system substrate-binding protein n=1 Tax=Kibdelosporangium banguiense TaxID=1365924 RepID=A0ABS4TP50_9PSEU|nr:ABC transporter substrate-binding protein [Kibdelosporangium banguiense]MBP2325703.1 oligopeptide transport system substrate-binding protein [Kibdelosporangium banguiense]
MRLIMLLLAAVLTVTACSTPPKPKPEPTPDPGPRPDVLTVGIREPTVLLNDRMINRALYTPLVEYDPATGKTTPVGAESVTTTDQITWTIKLRPSQYHDGTPVTASSYVDAWLRPNGDDLVPYKEIVPVDDLTIRYVTAAPASYFPAFLASPHAAPVRPHFHASNPIGNGAFKLAAPWDDETGGTLIRVAPAGRQVREIDIRVVDDLDAAFDEVRAGTLDIVTDVAGSRRAAMRQEFADRHVTWPKPEAAYLIFGPDMPDPAARSAIAMSLDRKALAEGLLNDDADPATGLYPPAVGPGAASDGCRACGFDPATAKSLRDQAGLKSLTIREGNATEMTSLTAQIRSALGVRTDFGPGPVLQSVEWSMDSPYVYGFPEVPSAQPFLDAAAASGDPQERARNYRLAEQEALRDFTVVPLWTVNGHAVWAERVHGVTATAAHGIDLAAITL